MTPEPTADESPFITIWDAPRETIRRIVDRDPRRHVNLLFFAAGAIGTLDALAQFAERFPMPPLAVPVVCLVTGLVAIPFGHLGAWYKRLISRLFGGLATQAEAVAVAAWATVPTVAGHAALWGIRFGLYGTELFRPDHPTVDTSPRLLTLSLGLASMLVSTWSVYVAVVAFAEVSRFSVGRSILTSLVTPVLVVTWGATECVGPSARPGVRIQAESPAEKTVHQTLPWTKNN